MTLYHLNRKRGEESIYAKYIAIGLGLLFGLATWSPYIGTAVAVGYLAGESMAWGEWIGGIIRWAKNLPVLKTVRRDGLKYGISKIALKFSKIDTLDYHVTSLFLRGLYWWLPTLAPLYWALDPFLVTMSILFLASWFPLSVLMAESDGQQWQNAEYIYGGAQDVVIGILFIAALLETFYA